MDPRTAQLFAAMDAADAEAAKDYAELVAADERFHAQADASIASIRQINQGLSACPTRGSSQIDGRTFNGIDRPAA